MITGIAKVTNIYLQLIQSVDLWANPLGRADLYLYTPSQALDGRM